MRKQILFIQGAGEGAYTEDLKLADNLQQVLGNAYEVRYPKMQNEIDVPYTLWVQQIKKELATLSGTIILAGHSVGGSVLIKFLAEENIQAAIAGVFLIAAPYWGSPGWTYEGYETLMLPDEAHTKFPDDVPLFLYQSRDDETVPVDHLALYARRFPQASVTELSGRGHQLNNDLSEVANDIRTLGH
ncbi:MAG TPA: alpha/beta hydrolase [Ohtaekwangia sp.]